MYLRRCYRHRDGKRHGYWALVESQNRGRENRKGFPLPPNRTGGSPASGSPVGGLTSERIDEPVHVQLSRRTAHAGQRKHSASEDGPTPVLVPADDVSDEGCFALACAPIGRAGETWTCGCA